ncbi:cell wall hydrolase [Ammoniphilus resinae]|uniref:N-acetylmuramoyl-L-alanine amidase n=1 Tax=Ammoniphilus resinae TaxID=861532 RepID=A0ABS4GU11_9BACL|nr:cell wall hydrolase [Ammoniphilus resinae]MBP1933768.1 N-acetylmuramoyl-L-alanine amidase [Ammoniphilus resinae]
MFKKWISLSICFILTCLSMNAVEAVESVVYKVKKGDTLWHIAKMNHVDLYQLKRMNNLKGDLIYPGDMLTIPKARNKKEIQMSKKDFQWFVKIIEAEAGGESFTGKVAVASVVLNRVLHKDYPNSVTDVIFQKINGVYQFSPVGDGRIHKVQPSNDSYKAASQALKGTDPTKGALFFYNPTTARSKWIRSRVVIREIGSHHFAY